MRIIQTPQPHKPIAMHILHRRTGAALFDDPNAPTLRDAVIAAVAAGANLDGATLDGANLDGADLTRANLTRATLDGADLTGADLYGADLYGADLTGANLTGADLTRATLDGEVLTKAPLPVVNLHWPVFITEGHMRIGCQRHTHAEWASFDSEIIEGMDGHASEFWAQWKAPLLALCAAHAAGGEAAR